MAWKRTAFLLAAASLAGCASAQRASLPDGRPGYKVSCSGIQHTLADCDAKAAKVCPTGYDIASKDLTTTVLNPFQRSMLVSCRM
ncbi:hypothetical protein ACELLULO517_16125 [Acidisoma cellulosilytica]|uniref:Lipoprotein n=1 Tax=Acidisoma cellulosilyticum TaxID=2802395 RepID=A0A964E4V8_9PROT|nr:hypothetical protein [Acidisoma cellulosilyticum]MCB8881777.1 hypothetical protein [Acidisoma cellulosilyticum]